MKNKKRVSRRDAVKFMGGLLAAITGTALLPAAGAKIVDNLLEVPAGDWMMKVRHWYGTSVVRVLIDPTDPDNCLIEWGEGKEGDFVVQSDDYDWKKERAGKGYTIETGTKKKC